MKILVIGGGGREHALAWKLLQSARAPEVICAPGNAGIAEDCRCLPVEAGSVDALLQLAARVQPDVTVVGPELPLSLGVVDAFQQRGLRIFGPTQAAARLESSKSFAKELMQRHNIPTAHFAVCASLAELKEALPHFHPPVVVKADGLAAGKGVVVAPTLEDAAMTAAEMLTGNVLGGAGSRVVLEEFLEGEELSFLVVSDGERVAPLAAAQDHKRAGDGDTGANTGGMGAFSTDALLDAQTREWLLAHIARPAIEGMRAEGTPYRGVLYCGLMLTARGPMLLEYKFSFGDPETQPILMRMESDLVEAVEACIEERVSEGDFRWSSDAAACVVLTSGGYPGGFEVGKKISGLEEAGLPGVKIFHSATRRGEDGAYYTSGGRVLGVTARAADLAAAIELAYSAAGKIHFDGMRYRHDIGAKAMTQKS
jgi:phosphoribosylamine--glycine ligase